MYAHKMRVSEVYAHEIRASEVYARPSEMHTVRYVPHISERCTGKASMGIPTHPIRIPIITNSGMWLGEEISGSWLLKCEACSLETGSPLP
jgi:hypothetical protein